MIYYFGTITPYGYNRLYDFYGKRMVRKIKSYKNVKKTYEFDKTDNLIISLSKKFHYKFIIPINKEWWTDVV